jgi:hypothetical protein
MSRIVPLSVLVFAVMLSAIQTLPAQTKAFKDKSGTCQVLVPAEWQLNDITSMMDDPKNLISVAVFWERDAKGGPMSALAMGDVETVFENTAQRVFYQSKPTKLFGPPTYAFTAYTPAPQKGACHTSISMKTGADEAAAKKIALTLGPSK